MKNTDLRAERDRDLYEVYLRGIREHDFASNDEAVDWARRQPARRFYISGAFCRLMMGRMLAGKPQLSATPNSQAKFKALAELFRAERERDPGADIQEISYRIVEMPAPSFFIDLAIADRIIHKERRQGCSRIRERYVQD